MDPNDQLAIDNNINLLMKIKYVDALITELLHRKVLFPYLVDQLLMIADRNDKVKTLFEELKCRGPSAFEHLLSALAYTGNYAICNILNQTRYPSNSTYSKLSVIKPDKCIESFDESQIYRMTSEPRGFALIININSFLKTIRSDSKHEERTGSYRDVANLFTVLYQLGYVVNMHYDLTKKEILERVNSFANMSEHAEVDSTIVVAMSHGGEIQNAFKSYDDQEVHCDRDIVAPFKTKYLQGKPKIFIFQFCRGDGMDHGIECEKNNSITSSTSSTVVTAPIFQDRGRTSSQRQSTSCQCQSTGCQRQSTSCQHHSTGCQCQSTGCQCQSTSCQRQSTGSQCQSSSSQRQSTGGQSTVEGGREPLINNIFQIYSTSFGYKSIRDPVQGGTFIHFLCKVFAEYASCLELRDLIQETTQRLTATYNVVEGFMTPTFTCSADCKKFYFNPYTKCGYGNHYIEATNSSHVLEDEPTSDLKKLALAGFELLASAGVEQLPSAVTEQLASAVAEQQTSAVVEQLTSAVAEEQTSDVVEQPTSADVDDQWTSDVVEQPTSAVVDQLTSAGSNSAVKISNIDRNTDSNNYSNVNTTNENNCISVRNCTEEIKDNETNGLDNIVSDNSNNDSNHCSNAKMLKNNCKSLGSLNDSVNIVNTFQNENVETCANNNVDNNSDQFTVLPVNNVVGFTVKNPVEKGITNCNLVIENSINSGWSVDNNNKFNIDGKTSSTTNFDLNVDLMLNDPIVVDEFDGVNSNLESSCISNQQNNPVNELGVSVHELECANINSNKNLKRFEESVDGKLVEQVDYDEVGCNLINSGANITSSIVNGFDKGCDNVKCEQNEVRPSISDEKNDLVIVKGVVSQPGSGVVNYEISVGNPGISVGNPGVSVGNPGVSDCNSEISVENPRILVGNPEVSVGNPGVSVGNPEISVGNHGISDGNPGNLNDEHTKSSHKINAGKSSIFGKYSSKTEKNENSDQTTDCFDKKMCILF